MLLHRSNWTLADLGFSSSSSSSSGSGSSPDASSAHSPVLSLGRLHVTTVDNFWPLAMAAHYNGTVSPRLSAPDAVAQPMLLWHTVQITNMP